VSALADRDEFYRARARAVLGDAMFEHCRQVALSAPAPSPEQVAVIGRIFGPGMRRLAAREAEAPAVAA